ncbi:sensor histidine kinase [Streptomyces sp. NPDC014735]|uniref:sensor histidine kinase n=1 Tax=unclassified Streptomyces TaxID=2593676 RepID=UPI0036FA2838
MAAPSSSAIAKRLVVAVGAAAALVAVAMVVLGLNPWMTAVVILVVALGTAAWALVELRNERARLRTEVLDLEVSALLLAERIRVAREVHDLVSHGLGMITVRASSALHLARQDPGTSPTESEHALFEALTDIERTSREATTGLRRTIQALRDPDETAALQPVESLEALPAVIAQSEAAGLAVTYQHGDVSGIPASVQATIVALVREGMANAARHAGPTDVHLSLDHDHGVVTVSVQDAGPSPSWRARTGSGHGLIGLRERVAALGGTLHAGPGDSGAGYELRAVFGEVGA